MEEPTAKLKCDEDGCDWTVEAGFHVIPQWHKKPCPKCGKGEIVSDGDMVFYHRACLLLYLDKAVDPEKKGPRVNIEIDTAKLRK